MTNINYLNALVSQIGEEYKTFNPFIWAKDMNLKIYWKEIGPKPLAVTTFLLDKPLTIMSNELKSSNRRYFILAHEMGHALMHKTLKSYYISNNAHRKELEDEANEFAIVVVTNLYIEEYGNIPTFKDLSTNYGAERFDNHTNILENE